MPAFRSHATGALKIPGAGFLYHFSVTKECCMASKNGITIYPSKKYALNTDHAPSTVLAARNTKLIV